MVDLIFCKLRTIVQDKRGLESLEYAVFAVAFLVIIGAAVTVLGGDLSTAYSMIGSWLSTDAASM